MLRSMSGDGKRGDAGWPKPPRPSSTLPKPDLDSAFGKFIMCQLFRVAVQGVCTTSSTSGWGSCDRAVGAAGGRLIDAQGLPQHRGGDRGADAVGGPGAPGPVRGRPFGPVAAGADGPGAPGRGGAAGHPAEAKRLGRLVRGFDEATWNAARYGIVLRGSLAKFGQHDGLRRYLLSTAPRVLVEASPVDTVWGIGVGAGGDAARCPSRWRGLVLLGFALTAVRQSLATGR